jgi:hypothetical protein
LSGAFSAVSVIRSFNCLPSTFPSRTTRSISRCEDYFKEFAQSYVEAFLVHRDPPKERAWSCMIADAGKGQHGSRDARLPCKPLRAFQRATPQGDYGGLSTTEYYSY